MSRRHRRTSPTWRRGPGGTSRAVEALGTYDASAADPFVVFVRLAAAVRSFDFTQMNSSMGNTLRQYVSMCSRFGLTPSDRTKVPTVALPSSGNLDDEFATPGTVTPLRVVPTAPYVAPTPEARVGKPPTSRFGLGPTPPWMTEHRRQCTKPDCHCRIPTPWEIAHAATPTAPAPEPTPKPTPPASTPEPEWRTNWKRERDAKKAAAVGSSPGPKAGQSPPEGLASGPLTLPTE